MKRRKSIFGWLRSIDFASCEGMVTTEFDGNVPVWFSRRELLTACLSPTRFDVRFIGRDVDDIHAPKSGMFMVEKIEVGK